MDNNTLKDIHIDTICNICGQEFDFWDGNENFAIHTRLGYGTKFDGDILDLHICCDCMENIIQMCSVSPIEEADD